MTYLSWDKKIVNKPEDSAIANLYEQGYLFTRTGKGSLNQTRSSRINLHTFRLTSENRRILKKIGNIEMNIVELPLRGSYDWTIGKHAKDFYDTKFGIGTMSAQKIKEMLTDHTKSNFNTLLVYSREEHVIGYAICYFQKTFMHYSYPFYIREHAPKDMGLGMMIVAIQYAHAQNMDYVYVGSLQRPSDTYKLQFEGLEWFDGTRWQTDTQSVKNILASANM